MQEHVRPPIDQEASRNWWGRNWMWAAPSIVVGAVTVIVGFIAVLAFFVFTMMKSSDAYKEAVARARAHPAIRIIIGTPIEEGMFVTGSINTSGQSGNADLAIPISGPYGEATIHVDATKTAGRWTFNMLFVETHESGERFDLLE